jgi:hypothetical protein
MDNLKEVVELHAHSKAQRLEVAGEEIDLLSNNSGSSMIKESSFHVVDIITIAEDFNKRNHRNLRVECKLKCLLLWRSNK